MIDAAVLSKTLGKVCVVPMHISYVLPVPAACIVATESTPWYNPSKVNSMTTIREVSDSGRDTTVMIFGSAMNGKVESRDENAEVPWETTSIAIAIGEDGQVCNCTGDHIFVAMAILGW